MIAITCYIFLFLWFIGVGIYCNIKLNEYYYWHFPNGSKIKIKKYQWDFYYGIDHGFDNSINVTAIIENKSNGGGTVLTRNRQRIT